MNYKDVNKALEAFGVGDWFAGLRFAEKTDLKDARIQYWMGCFHEDGYLFERSPYLAVEWYRKAAEQGHEEAKHRLGRMHLNGGCYSFAEEAEWVSWKRCREAAERGDAEAQANWGALRLDRGDFPVSLKWFRESAAQGNAKGQCYMGEVYKRGLGVRRDEQEALRWNKEAAKNGGHVVEKNKRKQFLLECERLGSSGKFDQNDFVKGNDGRLRKRVKTGAWIPLPMVWMPRLMYDSVLAIHRLRRKSMSKELRDASLGEIIFGKEGPEHEGYGTGELQQWADRMVKEGKDPHYVNLLEWFNGASSALDYHMGRRTFDDLMEQSRQGSDGTMCYIIERMQEFIPQLETMPRDNMIETIRQKYYTIPYVPYGVTCRLGKLD